MSSKAIRYQLWGVVVAALLVAVVVELPLLLLLAGLLSLLL
jgi:hypothetical protein